jgi:hypothetical protein
MSQFEEKCRKPSADDLKIEFFNIFNVHPIENVRGRQDHLFFDLKSDQSLDLFLI